MAAPSGTDRSSSSSSYTTPHHTTSHHKRKAQSVDPSPSVPRQLTLDHWRGVDGPGRSPAAVVSKLDQLYWIRKPAPDERWKMVATPLTKGLVAEDTDTSYPLYVEGRDWIGLPRFLGRDLYGPATTSNLSEGAPMNPDLRFTWELQDTPQKPQKAAIQAWLDNHGEGVLCLPCGAGKTVIAVYLALLKRRRTLILVQNGGLLLQWQERIQAICPQARVGIIQQDKCQIEGQDCVLGMIQTVRQSTADFRSFGMVIVDECHHIAAKTFSQSVMKTCPRYILGLSATPERRDGLTYVLHGLLGPLVYKSERRDLTPQHITQIEYDGGNRKVVLYKNGVKGVPTMVTRMTQDVRRNQLVDACVQRLLTTPGIRKILVISDRREHLETLHQTYTQQQYRVGLYIGNMKKADLEATKQQQIILASYAMAKEYLDIDGLNGMVLATPCLVDTEQVVGRLRENLASAYGLSSLLEDADWEEQLEFVGRACQWTRPLLKLVQTYARTTEPSRTRLVYDIVDTFDLFDAVAWKRFQIYKRLGYCVRRVSTDVFWAHPGGPS